MASFLSNLSWHDDNKIQMYQASEEVKIKIGFALAFSFDIVCTNPRCRDILHTFTLVLTRYTTFESTHLVR